jgi:gentisate 1,2-dioxygenase
VVEGEKLPMEEGDLILTPSMTWHGHRNGGEPVVWLDGLDNPLLFLLQAITWEAFPGGLQPMKRDADLTAPRIGATRPTWEKVAERAQYNLHYKWRDTYEKLSSLRDGPGSPYDGVALEYVNPEGGHTMPTMSCAIQLLRPGEITRTHRHNHSVVYHAFRGRGTLIVNGEKFDWEQGDCFVLPLWAWHGHQNRSNRDDAILFSVSELPVMAALKLHREEAGEAR